MEHLYLRLFKTNQVFIEEILITSNIRVIENVLACTVPLTT